MNATFPRTPSLAATLAPSTVPVVQHPLAPGGDAARQAIQNQLYYTQFYHSGRTDGLPDDERMSKAISLVQVAAHLPVTGVFNDDVRQAIDRYKSTLRFDVPTAPPPVTPAPPLDMPTPAAMQPPRRSLVRDLATFAILTSPAWGLLLLTTRPWARLRAAGTRR